MKDKFDLFLILTENWKSGCKYGLWKVDYIDVLVLIQPTNSLLLLNVI